MPGLGIDTSNYLKHTSANPLQRHLIARFHRAVAARVTLLRPASLLDAGCGEGFVSACLLERLPQLDLVGVDANPASVAHAQRAVPGGRFEVASVAALPFEDGSFDAVCCFEVLEHLDEPLAALHELARVSRRWVVLSVPHEPWFSLANAARGKNLDLRPRGSDPDHRQLWSRSGFGGLARQVLEVTWLGGSFPWTICVGKTR